MDTIDTRDTEFPGDDRAVDQHSSTALYDGAGKQDQVRHGWLDRIADEDLTLPEIAEVTMPVNTMHPSRCHAW